MVRMLAGDAWEGGHRVENPCPQGTEEQSYISLHFKCFPIFKSEHVHLLPECPFLFYYFYLNNSYSLFKTKIKFKSRLGPVTFLWAPLIYVFFHTTKQLTQF